MPNKWTDEKTEYLKSHYMDKTLDELADDLGVSRPTVINKKKELGLRVSKPETKWTEEKTEYLKAHYMDKTVKELADDLEVSIATIYFRKKELNLQGHKPQRGTAINWTDDKIRYLKTHYACQTLKETADVLGVSEATIHYKIKELGITRLKAKRFSVWTPGRIKYLKEHCGDETIGELSNHLGISMETIRAEMKLLQLRGLKRGCHTVKWTEEKTEYLKAHYMDKTLRELADELGVNPLTITNKKRELGLCGAKYGNKWTDEKTEYLKAHYMDKTVKELADELGVAQSTVANKKSKLGLINTRSKRKE